jgi:RHS repeat-associated protein
MSMTPSARWARDVNREGVKVEDHSVRTTVTMALYGYDAGLRWGAATVTGADDGWCNGFTLRWNGTLDFETSRRKWVASKERDGEIGLDYFGERYYSGAQGRFTSPDEPLIDQYPSDPQSWNLYAYARNSPLTNTDPNGRWCTFGRIGNTCGDKDIPQPPAPKPPPVPQGAPGTPTYPLTQAQDQTRKDPAVQPIPGGSTFCNIATCKIARATGAPLDPLTDKNGTPNLANTDNKTLPNSSKYHEVTPEEAQQLANTGVTVIAVQGSSGPHGHITTVRPDNTYFSPYEVRPGGQGPVINNIGRHVEVDRASQAFAKDRPVRYYAPNK